MEKHFLDQLDLKKLMELTIALDCEGDGISIIEKEHHKIITAHVDEETVIINSEGAIALPIDNITISINSEGKLVATGVKAGKAVAFEDSEGVKTINVVVDAETIKIGDDNQLFVPIDEKTIFIDSEEKVAVNIDNETIQYNESEGYLQVPTYDFNAEHGLYIREDSETVLIGAKIDGTTIVLNSEGALSATFQTSTADIPIAVGSEGKISLKYAKPLVVVNSELTVKCDSETIIVNTDGALEAVVFEGIKYDSPTPDGHISDVTIDNEYEGWGTLSGVTTGAPDGTLLLVDDATKFTADMKSEFNFDLEYELPGGGFAVMHAVLYQETLDQIAGKGLATVMFVIDGTNSGSQRILKVFNGKVPTEDGKKGLVPAPTTSEVGYFLNANGNWEPIPEIDAFEGTDGTAEGKKGLVPAPTSSEAGYFLNASGNWEEITVFKGATVEHVEYDYIANVNSVAGGRLYMTVVSDDPLDLDTIADKVICAKNVQFANTTPMGDFVFELEDITATSVSNAYYVDNLKGNHFDNLLFKVSDANVLTVIGEAVIVPAEDGEDGLVPAPTTSEREFFLSGDGTWKEVDLSVFEGTDGAAEGKKGLVPAPTASEGECFLKGDGTWSEINVFKGIEKIETVAADYELEFMTVSAGTTNELRARTLDGSFDFSKVKSGEIVHFSGAIDIPDTFNNLTLRFLSMYGTGGITAPLDSATVNELKGKTFTELYLKFTSTPVLVSTNNWSSTAGSATGYVDGEKGLVPAPTTSEVGYFLNADGTWKALPFADVDNVTIKLDSENKISSTAMINGVQLAGDKNTEELKITWYGTQAEFNKLDSEGKLNEHTLYIINDSEGVAELIHYLDLTDKPKINGIELQGELTSSELSMYTRAEVDEIVNKIRTIIKADTLPTTPRRNTTYYIGPNADGKYQVIVIDGLGNQINLGFASGDAKVYTGVDPIKVTDTGTGAARIGLLYDDRYFGIMDTGELRVKLNGRGALRATDDGLNVITYTGGSKDGLVPAAADDKKSDFLMGDGTWVNILDVVYPVGSVYISATNGDTSLPAALRFVGTWERIDEGVVLWSTHGSANLGKYLDPVLPEISGSVSLPDITNEGERGEDALTWSGDVFATNLDLKGTSEGYRMGKIALNAMASSSVYSSTTDEVRPKSFTVCMWRRTA